LRAVPLGEARRSHEAARTVNMPAGLTFKPLARDQKPSHFDWVNIDRRGARVGKVRMLTDGRTLTIHSITIFPEFERRGYAKTTVDVLKESFAIIVADRVRPAAVGFWLRMGFRPDGDGNYVWERRERQIPHEARIGAGIGLHSLRGGEGYGEG